MDAFDQLDMFAAEPEPATAAGPARPETLPAGPTTVVCLKGRRDDPAIADVVYVGRPMFRGGWRLYGHPLSNPFRIGQHGTPEQVVERYERWLDERPELLAYWLPRLRGKRLGCWCEDGRPCHARVLAARADALEVDR